MAVPTAQMVSLSVGEEVTVIEGPCVLTDLIAAELSFGAPACVVLTGAGDWVSLVYVSLRAGETVSWHGALACGAGICVTSAMGDVAVTLGYY